MKLEQFEYIRAIVNLGSMTAASNALHISQQSISNSIKQLEDELGFKIFKRTKNGTTLTEQGAEVYQLTQSILNTVSQLKKMTNDISTTHSLKLPLSGTISIETTPAFKTILFPIIEAIMIQYPNIKFLIDEQDAFTINKKIMMNKFESDFAFTSASKDLVHSTERHDMYLLKNESLVLVTNKNSEYSSYKNISLSSLKKIPLVFYSATLTSEPLFLRLLKQNGCMIENYFTGTDIKLCKKLLNKQFCGIATPFNLATSNSDWEKEYYCIPLSKKIPISHYLIAPPQNKLSELQRLFLDEFQKNTLIKQVITP